MKNPVFARAVFAGEDVFLTLGNDQTDALEPLLPVNTHPKVCYL